MGSDCQGVAPEASDAHDAVLVRHEEQWGQGQARVRIAGNQGDHCSHAFEFEHVASHHRVGTDQEQRGAHAVTESLLQPSDHRGREPRGAAQAILL